MESDCSNDADCNVGWTGTCASCQDGQCQMDGYDGDDCTLTDGTVGQCNSGSCYPKGCTTNADCTESGTYCASPNSDYLERFPSGTTGSCAPVNFVRHEGKDGQTYYLSNSTISWWDAEFACDAIGGKELLSVHDLLTEPDGTTFKFYTEYGTLTDLAKELYNRIGAPYIFTKDLTSSNNAYRVHLSSGDYYSDWRHESYYSNHAHAVCK